MWGSRGGCYTRDHRNRRYITGRKARQKRERRQNELAAKPPQLIENAELSHFVTGEWGRWSALVYLLPAALFLLFKAYSAAPASGDENIYLYVGRRVAQGVVPYREIRLAHPPGHLFAALLWMLPGYFSPVWAKLAAIVPALVTLGLFLALLRRAAMAWPVALVTGLLLALSQDFLGVSSHFTGANWANLWLLAALVALQRGRAASAGTFLALAGLTAFHILPALIGVAVAVPLFRQNVPWRHGWRTAVVFVGLTLGVHLVCLIAFGSAYWDQVFGFHLAKTPMSAGGRAATLRFFFNEYVLAAPALLGVLFWSWRRWRKSACLTENQAVFGVLGVAAVFQLLGVLVVQRVFTYYLAPLVPLLAGLTAFALAEGLGFVCAWWEARKASQPQRKILIVLLISLTVLAGLMVGGEQLERSLGYYQRQLNQISTYTWKDSPVLPRSLNRAVKALVFDEKRRVGDFHGGLKRYLWHELATENPAGLLPEFEARADTPGTLFGDASTTPFFALMTGRTIALELADTNAQWFKSGVLDVGRVLDDLKPAPPAFLILDTHRGIGTHPAMRGFARDYYRRVAVVRPSKKGQLLLYERR